VLAVLRIGLQLLGGVGFGGGSQKLPRAWGCVDGRVSGEGMSQAGGGAISATAVCVGCQQHRAVVFSSFWCEEASQQRKSHGGSGRTSGRFVSKNEQGFDVCLSVGRFRLTC
jgi:hypothetical protein